MPCTWYYTVCFSFTRGVFYTDKKVVNIMKTEIHKYVSREVDIRKAPPRDPEYSRWCEDIYAARFQIGIICEDSSVKSGVDWTKGAEG